KNWKENQAPANGDTLVFDTTTSGFINTPFGNVPNMYAANNDMTNLTVNGIVMNNTTSTPWLLTGNGVTINNTSTTDTPGITDKSSGAGVNTISLASIKLGSNISTLNNSPAPTSTNPSFTITAPIDLAGKVLTNGAGGTSDTGLTLIS